MAIELFRKTKPLKKPPLKTPPVKPSFPAAPAGPKLGQLLKTKGLITGMQLIRALDLQKIHGKPLGQILTEQGYIGERDLAFCLHEQTKIPIIDFDKAPLDPEAVKLLSQQFAADHLVLPITLISVPEGNVLVVAMENPTNKNLIKEIHLLTGYPIKPLLALKGEIISAISEAYRSRSGIPIF